MELEKKQNKALTNISIQSNPVFEREINNLSDVVCLC